MNFPIEGIEMKQRIMLSDGIQFQLNAKQMNQQNNGPGAVVFFYSFAPRIIKCL